jgi:hypothetical protein
VGWSWRKKSDVKGKESKGLTPLVGSCLGKEWQEARRPFIFRVYFTHMRS